MQEFFLVVDTETSGLPKNWKAPYSDDKNWPHIVQIAWIIYDGNYQEIKRENHYIKNDGFKIDKGAENIHKISDEYLQINGEDLDKIMDLFCNDIIQFKPLIIGHFIELDYHMVNVELSRLGKEDIFENSTFYCTMKTSADYVSNLVISHLKLDKFYTILFNEEPSQMHNALADASNTAKIFFHLITNKKITLTSIYKQEHSFNKAKNNSRPYLFKRIIQRLFHGK